MTFLEAYAIHGPDVEEIAKAMGIAPPAADRLINAKMNRERLGPEGLKQPARKPIRFAGFDESEASWWGKPSWRGHNAGLEAER